MAEVPEDEIKVDITLGHVGRHCILHALTVIEAAISQVCVYVCVCVCVLICMYSSKHVCMCVHVNAYIHPHHYSNTDWFIINNGSQLFYIFKPGACQPHPLRIVSMFVCLCVCLSAPEAINN